jgi:cytochrome P450
MSTASAVNAPVAGLPPGPTRSPFLNVVDWVRRPLPLLEECQARYGDTFTLRFAAMPPIVMLADPEAVREVFKGDPDALRSGEANELLQAGLGRHSLILLDGREHLRERRLMLPPFHGERMRVYEQLIASIAERTLREWPSGTPLAVLPSLRQLALDVITAAVFGVEEPERAASLQRALTRFLDATTKPYRLGLLLMVKPDGPTVRVWQRHSPVLRAVNEQLFDVIRRRRSEPLLEERADVLSMLIQAGSMDDRHLRDELMTLLIAGHETTATGLAWAIERLARHPDAYAPLAEGGDEYVDAVVKETLRVRTIVPFVIRHVAEPVRVAGRELPAGVRVAPCVHLVHRRPEVYPEPGAFRPERFLENPAGTYTWIPFGGGTRRCLGGAFSMFEMTTVLRVIARAGDLEAADPGDEPVARRGVTLVPARGARVVWRPR